VLVAQPSALARSSDPSEVERQLGAVLDDVNRTLQAHEWIRFILLADREWNEANGLCTHSLKIHRSNVEAAYSGVIAGLVPEVERTGSKVHWQGVVRSMR
jgi:long-subunit acyl-CoA synthetase (AMP-forming)